MNYYEKLNIEPISELKMIILFLIFLGLFVYFVLNYDADMTTIFSEKYGKSVKEFFAGKVVWITGMILYLSLLFTYPDLTISHISHHFSCLVLSLSSLFFSLYSFSLSFFLSHSFIYVLVLIFYLSFLLIRGVYFSLLLSLSSYL